MKNYTEELLKLPFAVDVRKVLPRNPKKQWGKRDPSKLVGVCFHQSLDDLGSCSGTAKYDCGPNHISPDGLPGLSYTGFIEKDGRLWVAWDVEDKTWSQGNSDIPGDENEGYVAFCFGGNFSGPGYRGTQEPTQSQMNTAALLWEFWDQKIGFKHSQLFGHYHFGKPACPGYTLMNFIEETRLTYEGPHPNYDLQTTIGRQSSLAALGYYTGPIDGVWSLLCRYGLTQFQAATGITTDGVWGPMTDTAVLKALG